MYLFNGVTEPSWAHLPAEIRKQVAEATVFCRDKSFIVRWQNEQGDEADSSLSPWAQVECRIYTEVYAYLVGACAFLAEAGENNRIEAEHFSCTCIAH